MFLLYASCPLSKFVLHTSQGSITIYIPDFPIQLVEIIALWKYQDNKAKKS